MKKTRKSTCFLLIGGVLLCSSTVAAPPTTVGFEDLPNLPGLDGETSLEWANLESDLYQGINWDGVDVTGKDYRICPDCPAFGIPHTGNYFMSNDEGGVVTLTTGRVLMGLWVGQNEYYGYGGGADWITVHALDAQGQVLSSVSMDLPDDHDGLAEPLAWMDTSQFLKYSNIAGYRIDRDESSETATSWIGDDFLFVDSAPYVTIKGNQSEGPLSVSASTPVALDISLANPQAFEGTNADYWLVVQDDSGFSYFDLAAQSWVSVGSDYTGLKPTYQGGLQDMFLSGVVQLPVLSFGQTLVHAGVDTEMNGTVDMNRLYYDTLTLNVK